MTPDPNMAGPTAVLRRQRILEAATELLAEGGFAAASVAAVGRRAGVVGSALYYHFPSKTDLGKRLVARYREQFMEALAGLERESGDARRRLRRYVGLWTRVLRDRDRMCLCGMMAADIATLPPSVRSEIKRFFDENEAWLVRVITQGRTSKALCLAGTPEVEARLLTMGLEGAMLVARSYGQPRRFEEIADRLLKGLGIVP